MTTSAYDIGDYRRLIGTFTDIAGDAADPTTITFKMREPDGTETSYVYGVDGECVKSSTGVYYVDWSFDQAGRHVARWYGTGVLVASTEKEYYVLRKAGV